MQLVKTLVAWDSKAKVTFWHVLINTDRDDVFITAFKDKVIYFLYDIFD